MIMGVKREIFDIVKGIVLLIQAKYICQKIQYITYCFKLNYSSWINQSCFMLIHLNILYQQCLSVVWVSCKRAKSLNIMNYISYFSKKKIKFCSSKQNIWKCKFGQSSVEAKFSGEWFGLGSKEPELLVPFGVWPKCLGSFVPKSQECLGDKTKIN